MSSRVIVDGRRPLALATVAEEADADRVRPLLEWDVVDHELVTIGQALVADRRALT